MITQFRRDSFFDVLKGIAILLVILGHTIQSIDVNFDENIIFKIIYSFHMPLFIFASGAVLSLKYKNVYTVDWKPLQDLIFNCRKVLIRLFLPFICWTLIMYFTGARYTTMNLMEWLITVFHSVDTSLWFLLAIMYCLIFFYFTKFLLESFIKTIHPTLLIFFSLITFVVMYKFIPNIFGLAFFKMYYIYFLFGALWNLNLKKYNGKIVIIMPLIIFSVLIPFWSRTEPIFTHALLEIFYRLAIASAGILIMLNIVKLINDSSFYLFKNALAFFGVASLGIYAIHFNFLSFKPYIITPLVTSLIIIWLIKKSEILSYALLGEYKKKENSL